MTSWGCFKRIGTMLLLLLVNVQLWGDEYQCYRDGNHTEAVFIQTSSPGITFDDCFQAMVSYYHPGRLTLRLVEAGGLFLYNYYIHALVKPVSVRLNAVVRGSTAAAFIVITQKLLH